MKNSALKDELKSATRELFEEYSATRDEAVREKIIESHMSIARFFAKRFGSKSEQFEDLMQVATLGLINAVDRYDPTVGTEFATFATVTILGEIKRYFRDKTWSVKVPRRIKDLNLAVNQTIEKLTKDNDKPPTYDEIAKHLKCTVEEIIESREAVLSYNVVSLDREVEDENGSGTSSLMEMFGYVDSNMDTISDRVSIQACMKNLKQDEKIVIYNRYYMNLSQAQIAKMLGVSQMQVSRIQSSALEKLRRQLER